MKTTASFSWFAGDAAASPVGSARAQGKLNVMTTTEDLASIAREVGGDHVTVESIAKGYQDPHFVEAEAELHPEAAEGRPADRGRARAGDRLAAAARSAEPQREDPAGQRPAISTRRCRRQILEMPTGQVTRAMGDVHPLGNPHYWLDPEQRQAHRQGDRRQAVASCGRRHGRTSRSADRLRSARSTPPKSAGWRRWRRTRARRSSPITARGRTSPSASASTVIGYVEPKPGIPPTPQHTLDLINEMKRQNVKLILVEPYFDLKTPNAIGRETGAQVLVMPPSVGGVKEVTDYFKLFDYDINLLVDAIKKYRSQVSARWHRCSAFLAPAFVASLILDRHSRLSGRARRRARRHLRRSVAGADRGARRDDRDLLPCRAAIRTRRSSTGSAWLHVHRRVHLLDDPRPPARIPQEAIIGICYAVASAAAILAMSKATVARAST